MSNIIIRNIGAIKYINIDLNKVNVIMGPQSSGKSTIAKIISHCQWVNKRYILDGKFDYDFSEIFMKFHRIDKSYFNENSVIKYKSDSVKITYKGIGTQLQIEKLEQGKAFINFKNIYIPAERNFVSVIPNLGRYKETNDNIMNFLYDWFEAKKNYPLKNNIPLLELGASYHNIEGDDIDKISLSNSRELLLSNASSGLQSVTPLLVLVDYLSNFIYEDKTLSAKEFKQLKESLEPLLEIKEQLKVFLKSQDLKKRKEAEDLAHEVFTTEKSVIESINKLIRYHYTQFIIEEPEQNLFPTTQRDLVYHLLNKITKSEYDHNLLITTHSPFVLYALNNCMMGHNVRNQMPTDEQKELKSYNSWIDPKLVSVWEIDSTTGTLRNIKNPKTGTVDKHYFNNVMNEIMDEYYEMLEYLDL